LGVSAEFVGKAKVAPILRMISWLIDDLKESVPDPVSTFPVGLIPETPKSIMEQVSKSPPSNVFVLDLPNALLELQPS